MKSSGFICQSLERVGTHQCFQFSQRALLYVISSLLLFAIQHYLSYTEIWGKPAKWEQFWILKHTSSLLFEEVRWSTDIVFTLSHICQFAIMDGTINSALYQKILKENIQPLLDLVISRSLLQQDNDPKHTSKSIPEWLIEMEVLEWPS